MKLTNYLPMVVCSLLFLAVGTGIVSAGSWVPNDDGVVPLHGAGWISNDDGYAYIFPVSQMSLDFQHMMWLVIVLACPIVLAGFLGRMGAIVGLVISAFLMLVVDSSFIWVSGVMIVNVAILLYRGDASD